ncbi:MAG: Ig-like domain-containing protein [Oscillibacter sp.]|jgi:hypothetical protein|nr:Ig-like domain-containing protein [Oscillibacter sp.]
MAMKRCPVCGEKYSDTYRRCPFCEEAETLRSGNSQSHRGGHRVAQKGPSLLSPLLIVTILVMAGVLVYLLFGDAIAEKLGMGKAPVIPASSVSEPAGASSAPPVSGDPSSAGSSAAASSVDTGNLPVTLTVAPDDFTMKVGDAPVKLTVSGGSGSYVWSSEDDGVASVDKDGNVIAVSSGTVTVTVSDGSGKGECIVRIKGTGTPNAGSTAGAASLSQTDATIKVGESFTLRVTGTSPAEWSSANAGIASVSGGKVTGVAKGQTTVTAAVDGKTLTCIVRVK